jgi:hypothetical protein
MNTLSSQSQILYILNLFSVILTVYLQINMVKYDANWEITNTYKNLQIVWFQFFTDKLIFIYIWSNSNIYWFIGIQICCHWIQTNWLHLTIRNIWSAIWWAITKVILKYLQLPNIHPLNAEFKIVGENKSWTQK